MKLLRHGVWLAICDGRKAMLLENRGEAENPKLEMREIVEQANPPTHELGSAPPGRTFSTPQGRRAAMEETDLHDRAELEFLRQFAERIDERIHQDNLGALILAAPPRALGMLRPHLTDRTRQILVAELARDYVKMPLYEIERQIDKDS